MWQFSIRQVVWVWHWLLEAEKRFAAIAHLLAILALVFPLLVYLLSDSGLRFPRAGNYFSPPASTAAAPVADLYVLRSGKAYLGVGTQSYELDFTNRSVICSSTHKLIADFSFVFLASLDPATGNSFRIVLNTEDGQPPVAMIFLERR